jgi:hypothetical protein
MRPCSRIQISISLLIVIFPGIWTFAVGETNDHPHSTRAEPSVYYLDPDTGSDSNDGTHSSNAWRTFKPVNDLILNPGDSVLFKRGSIFSSERGVIVGDPGSKELPITYGTYGTGPKPVIDLHEAPTSGFYIYTSFIRIENIIVRNCGNQGFIMENRNEGTYGIEIIDCEAYNIGGNGILHARGGGDINIRNFISNNTGNSGIALMGSFDRKLTNVLVEGCNIGNATYNDGITIHEGDSTPRTNAGTGFRLIRNHAEYCAEQGFDISTGSDILMLNNTSTRNGVAGIVLGHSAHDIVIRGHRSWNESTGEGRGANVLIYVGNVTIEASIFLGGSYHTVVLYDPGENGLMGGIRFINNIFKHGGHKDILSIEQGVTGLEMFNNIFTSDSGTGPMILFLDNSIPPNTPRFSLDHNLYYSSTGFKFYTNAMDSFDLQTLRSMFGQETNGIESDPRLDLNMCPFPSSPLIDTGEDDPSNLDIMGSRIYGVRDIGPYEFVPRYILGSDKVPMNQSVTVFEDGRFDDYIDDDVENSMLIDIQPEGGWITPATGAIWKAYEYKIVKVNDSEIDIYEIPLKGYHTLEYRLAGMMQNKGFRIDPGGEELIVSISDINGTLEFSLPGGIERTIKLIGVLYPVLHHVSIPTTATTGDPFELSFRIASDLEIEKVVVSYSQGSKLNMPNIEKEGSKYVCNIIPLVNSTKQIELIIDATDVTGTTTQSDIYLIPVFDNDPPVIIPFNIPDIIGTGDRFDLWLEVKDNIGMQWVRLVYNYSGEGFRSVDLNVASVIRYSFTAPDNRAGPLSLLVIGVDVNGNTIGKGPYIIDVVDNDAPRFLDISISDIAIRGMTLRLWARIVDNSGYHMGFLEYRFDNDPLMVVPLSKDGDFSCATIEVPHQGYNSLSYNFRVSDRAGNNLTSAVHKCQLKDSSELGPGIWIMYPFNDDSLKGLVEITITLIGENEASSIELFVDGEPMSAMVAGGWDETVGMPLDTRTVPDGIRTIVAKALSSDGEIIAASDPIEFVINNKDVHNRPVEISIEPKIVELMVGDEKRLVSVLPDWIDDDHSMKILWFVEGDIGSIDENGHFVASLPGNGRVGLMVLSLGNEWTAFANISVVEGSPTDQVDRFEWDIAVLAVSGALLVAAIAALFFFIGRKTTITRLQRIEQDVRR